MFLQLLCSQLTPLLCHHSRAGTRYLRADLSVQCYEGWHLVFVFAALLSFIVYCLGIPLVLSLTVSLSCPRLPTCTAVENESSTGSSDRQISRFRRRFCCGAGCTRRSSFPWCVQYALTAGISREGNVCVLRLLVTTNSNSLPPLSAGATKLLLRVRVSVCS